MRRTPMTTLLRRARRARAENAANLKLVQDSLNDLALYLDESHQIERDTNHGGDGAAGCSYCKGLRDAKKADRALDKLVATMREHGMLDQEPPATTTPTPEA